MATESSAEHQPSSSRMKELRDFDETKAGVKGLVDAGITKVPLMFIHPPEALTFTTSPKSGQFSLPTIDLDGMGKDPIRHKQIVDRIRDASESWGFFRVINHGISLHTLEDMINGTRNFHEQDVEIKEPFYTREHRKGLVYCSNYNLYTLVTQPIGEWRDMFTCYMTPVMPEPEDLPVVCREILIEYSKQVMELGCSLFRLLSEGLGLEQNHLLDMGCAEGLTLIGHYYPPCPEPELTIGIRKHSDNTFMTILLQDDVGGLQILHQNEWVNVEPIISNDKFTSVEHRVLAKSVGPRTSVASFFSTGRNPSSKAYGPIKELLSVENPPKYGAMTIMEYNKCFQANGADGSLTLQQLKL
ncbi:hypothetical protein BUALT_Bualt14G0111500 [Buddleja alternifolia]|uniref:Fe2OG dioxygenase domain-containing protein n=1 Tax=Buddleja alternifolia TaxID=168488 RepID=A0AAV6WNB2_9LAMI|nr:hypothetical protein BUALT_Bualt14G0111500 [Buddleja alternifolia]